ncbi:MAG: hypothetical protein ACXWXT_09205 [Candidatus Binatia bacterium]
MPSRKTPRLDSGLIARKGEAAPVTSSAATKSAPKPIAPKGIAGTIAVTVRLDPERYEKLKLHGIRTRRTNQDILVQALDVYLATVENP